MKSLICPLASIAILLAAPSQAQDYQYAVDVDTAYRSAYINSAYILDAIVDRNTGNNEDDEKHDDRPKPSASTLTYQVSQSRRQANQRRFLSKNPRGAELAQTDVIGQLEQAMRPVGLRADNVADAYAIWWVSAWEAVNGKDAPDSPALYAAVKGQASRALLATSQFAGVTDAQKQEMAESMLIQAMMVDAYIQGTAGNPAQQAELAKAVNQGAKAMGLDLTTMNLTEQGFSARNR